MLDMLQTSLELLKASVARVGLIEIMPSTKSLKKAVRASY